MARARRASLAEEVLMQHRHPLASRWVLCAALSFGASACATSAAEGPVSPAKKVAGSPVSVGEPIPNISVRAVNGGGTIDLGSMKGKVVLLDIWASWCAPCREEMPLLDDMAARLKDRGIEFVAVSIDEEKAAARAFLSARPKWTLTVAHDPQGKIPDLFQPPKMPTSYLIDSHGVLRYVNAGFDRADVKKIEDRLLTLAGERS
jgi:thiol-disulfide isomerase/thioredoxin